MILRNHTYLKVYKCWRILPILKMPTIKWLAIFFKKYFNFQGFYIVYIIIWRFLGWKKITPSKLGETGLQKMQIDNFFFEKQKGKIALGLNFTPKISFVVIIAPQPSVPWFFLFFHILPRIFLLAELLTSPLLFEVASDEF